MRQHMTCMRPGARQTDPSDRIASLCCFREGISKYTVPQNTNDTRPQDVSEASDDGEDADARRKHRQDTMSIKRHYVEPSDGQDDPTHRSLVLAGAQAKAAVAPRHGTDMDVDMDVDDANETGGLVPFHHPPSQSWHHVNEEPLASAFAAMEVDGECPTCGQQHGGGGQGGDSQLGGDGHLGGGQGGSDGGGDGGGDSAVTEVRSTQSRTPPERSCCAPGTQAT